MNLTLLRGKLSGMGREADCQILASKNPAGSNLPYSELMVVEAPSDFPNGEYEVGFEGYTARVTKHEGLWLMMSLS